MDMTHRTIYKYPLLIAEHQKINVPEGSELLDIQTQSTDYGDVIMTWFSVDTGITTSEEKQIFIVGTGNKFNSDGKRYLRTVQHGRYVWHIFEGVS